MPSTLEPVAHIRVEEGRAWIEGTSYQVLDVILDHLAYGWSPAEIHFQHCGKLSMAQIHAAMSYYYDHQVELDAEIQQQMQRVDALRAQAGLSPFVERLRAEGKLP
jgi:uncharacterized protein (DUF433 family)